MKADKQDSAAAGWPPRMWAPRCMMPSAMLTQKTCMYAWCHAAPLNSAAAQATQTWHPGSCQGANILVSTTGTVKLADFGASKKIEELASCGGQLPLL